MFTKILKLLLTSFIFYLSVISAPVSGYAQANTAIIKKAAAAVVTIYTENNTKGKKAFNSAGSGVIYDGNNGYIITNDHVLIGAEHVTVYLSNGDKYPADILGRDSFIDLAVIKIKPAAPLPSAVLSKKMPLINEPVIAIGSPNLKANTVTTGKVTNENLVEIFTPSNNSYLGIQTDAPIDHGSSGGGLFDTNGNLIAINAAALDAASGKSVSWSIPIHHAIYVLPFLENNIKSNEALANSLTAQDSLSYKDRWLHGSANNTVSVVKVKVPANSNIFAKDYANIKRGDIITAYGNQHKVIKSSLEFQYLLKYSPHLPKIKFYTQRDKKENTIIMNNDANNKAFIRYFKQLLSHVTIKEFSQQSFK